MKQGLSFYYNWKDVPDDLFRRLLREFADHGVKSMVFTNVLAERALDEKDFPAFLKKTAKELNLEFVSMHAPFGPDQDLNTPVMEARENMIDRHLRAMRIAAESGSLTYTVHIGAYHHCYNHVPLDTLRPLAVETLERLIPEAEKLGIVIAVENSFEPPNSAAEVLNLVKNFSSSPAAGVCFDAGHANCMATAPGKKLEFYSQNMRNRWWENGIIPEDNAMETLRDFIVTTHLHDNDGYSDLHGMPGDGTINWPETVAGLRSCPRMLEYQTEVSPQDGENWAGKLLAPPGGYSIKQLVEVFRNLGF